LTLAVTAGVLASGVFVAPASGAAPVGEIRGSDSPGAIPGSYIVVFKDNASVKRAGIKERAKALVDRHKGKLRHVFEHALHGFSATMSEQEAKALAADPDVDYVHQNTLVQTAGTDKYDTVDAPRWNLDRVDQRDAAPLSGTYSYDNLASNVHAYVIDTGIRISHTEFEGRASYGRDFVDNDFVADDCNGHGTHVAGILGGKTYGVAKGVKLVSVRVFGCGGSGGQDDAIAGINWVQANAIKPAVANMSIQAYCAGGNVCADIDPVSQAIGELVVNGGVTAVTAAGNRNVNACTSQYARSPHAIAVGNVTSTDAKASTSNWGGCVNIWAPGTNILSAYHGFDTDSATLSGTSMAAPHVAGAAALVLGRNPSFTTNQVFSALLTMSTPGKVTGLTPGAGDNNRLLYTSPSPVKGGSHIALARAGDGKMHVFGANPNGEAWHRSQTTAGEPNAWSAWDKIGGQAWSVAAQAINPDGNIWLTSTNYQENTQNLNTFYYTRQNGAGWTPTSAVLEQKLTAVATATGDGGRGWMFGVGPDGKVWYKKQLVIGADNWDIFLPLNLPPGIKARSIAAEADDGGRVHVAIIDQLRNVLHAWQELNPSGPPVWTGFKVVGSTRMDSIALALNDNGRLHMFGTNNGGTHVLMQTADNMVDRNNWGAWQPTGITTTQVAAETDANGRMMVIGTNQAGLIYYKYQVVPGTWVGANWQAMDGILRPYEWLGSGSGAVNVAQNKTATADSSCSPNEGAAKANNGTWTGGLYDKWCSLSANKWWKVDLFNQYPIGSVTIHHAEAGGEFKAWNTRDFTIQVSNDNTNWTTVATVTNNVAGTTTHPIGGVLARYVRLNITVPTSSPDTAARIYEIEVNS